MESSARRQSVWDELYSTRGRQWSGHPNARLVELAADLPPGDALDLGCGEGGDALWLARRGWRVVGADVSPVALQRAEQAAADAGLSVTFAQHDLTTSFPDGTFDLVSAHYLHHSESWDRAAVLRRAAAALRPGGVLLVVGHAGVASWSTHDRVQLPEPEEVLAGLALPADWERLRVESATREAHGPDGEQRTVVDAIVMVRRPRRG